MEKYKKYMQETLHSFRSGDMSPVQFGYAIGRLYSEGFKCATTPDEYFDLLQFRDSIFDAADRWIEGEVEVES